MSVLIVVLSSGWDYRCGLWYVVLFQLDHPVCIKHRGFAYALRYISKCNVCLLITVLFCSHKRPHRNFGARLVGYEHLYTPSHHQSFVTAGRALSLSQHVMDVDWRDLVFTVVFNDETEARWRNLELSVRSMTSHLHAHSSNFVCSDCHYST